VNQYSSIKAIACGHVHRQLIIEHQPSKTTVFTCPATSIQFDPTVDGVKALDEAPQYQVFQLFNDGSIEQQTVSL
jgi:Icc protein